MEKFLLVSIFVMAIIAFYERVTTISATTDSTIKLPILKETL